MSVGGCECMRVCWYVCEMGVYVYSVSVNVSVSGVNICECRCECGCGYMCVVSKVSKEQCNILSLQKTKMH